MLWFIGMDDDDYDDQSFLNDSFSSDISFCFSEPDNQPKSIQLDLTNGSTLNANSFIAVHWNINSILTEGRLEELSENIGQLKPQIVVLTESKLDNTIPNNLITIPGFHEPLRRDRNRHGGGCLVYISQTLTFKQQYKLQSDYFENISVDVKVHDKVYSINCYYRPPDTDNHDLFLEETEQMLSRLNNHNVHTKLILSDLNFGNIYCKQPILPHKLLDSSAPEIFSSFNFHQIIDIPTRVKAISTFGGITQTTISLIDLIFINNFDNLQTFGTVPPLADHEGIFASFHCIPDKQDVITKTIYDYKKADEKGLREFIQKYDFQSNVFLKPVHEQPPAMCNILKTACNKFIPTKKITIKPFDQPWINSYTRLLMRKKNRNYRILKRVNIAYFSAQNRPNCPVEIVTQLREKRDRVAKRSKFSDTESKKANRRAKNVFFNTVNATMQNYEISAKKKFNILTKLMKNQKTSCLPPLLVNGEIVNDSQRKSDLLNDIFVKKATVEGNDDPVPDLEPIESILDNLNTINTSPIEVSKILRTLKKSNSSHCGIPGKFLNIIATPISFGFSRMLNNCFEIGHFPDIFKISHVTAIWKRSGLKSDPSCYRPISLLPSLSKAMEAIIHKRLLDHVMTNNVITDRQAAYLKGDSTIQQLLYIVNLIRKSWTKGCITHGIFLDVSAAFDKCWHKGIIAKLKQIKVEGSCLDLFTSYLTNRKQCTVVSGQKSEMKAITAGVPQGSKLGPLLWIIYCNDIIKDIDSEILLFADDTCCFVSGTDPAETAIVLNRDLAKLNLWADKWKVTFNPGKSKDIIFSERKYLFNSPAINFGGSFVERVHEHKHLGVYLSSNLSWARQVHETCLKANRKLAVLRSVRYLKRSTLDILYKVCVRSTLEYGLVIYYHTLKQTEIARVQQIQYRAAKLCTGALHFTNQIKLEQDLAWESISNRVKFLGLSIFHKIHCFQTRPLIRKCLPKLNISNLRGDGNYEKGKFKSQKYSNSFFPYFSQLWSKLDKSLKGEGDQDIFKAKLKQILKPKKQPHYKIGNKHINTLHCRLRVGRSFLKAHGFAINLSPTDKCLCGDIDNTKHYLLTCFLFQEERVILFDTINSFYPTFKRLSAANKTELLLFGINLTNVEPDPRNRAITFAVQKYIAQTNRFSRHYD